MAGSAGAARSVGLAAGLAAGLTCLVRVDALRELTLLLPVVAVLWLARHPAAGGLLRGLVVGLAVSVTAAVLLAEPYLRDIAGSLVPLCVLFAVVAVASAATVRWLPRWPRRLPRRWPRGPAWLPAAVGSAVLAGGLLLATRPLFLTVRQDPDEPGARVVAGLQAAQGLVVDGGRTYAEQSVQWLVWYLGPVTPVLALLAAAEATRRAVVRWREGRREDRAGGQSVPPWAPLLFVGGLSTAAVLWRPAITPDHPWADRRLVPVVLPFVLVCATAAVAWATRAARRRLPATLLVAIGAAGVAAMIVPAAVATWPVAGQRTERGQLEAVRRVCGALRPDDAVIMVDVRAATEWPQTVRGVCGVPAAVLRLGEAERRLPRLPTVSAAVPALAERVAATGRRPVLMTAQDPTPLLALGLEPRRVVQALSNEDQRLLTRRPDGDSPLPLNVWLAPWDATKRAATR